jgi:hypothetical protein
MSKSYSDIQVKCNECGTVISVPLRYEDDRDRWTRANGANPRVEFEPNYKQWTLSDGMDGRDCCPSCRVILATEERQRVVDDCETDEPIPKPENS